MKKKELILVMFMVVMIAFGLFLPQSVLSFMDQKAKSKTEIKEMDNIKFNNNNSLINAITLMSRGYDEYKIKPNALNHTAEEIYKENKVIIKELGKYFESIKLENIKRHSETPVFLMENNAYATDILVDEKEIVMLKATVWKCSISTKSGEWFIYIDDVTGKMVQFGFYVDNKQNLFYADLDDYYEKMQKFCKKYYDLSVTMADKKISSKVYDDSGDISYTKTGRNLVLVDKESNESVKIVVSMDNAALEFNELEF